MRRVRCEVPTRRYLFGKRLRQVLAGSTSTPSRLPCGLEGRAAYTLESVRNARETIELVWWFVVPIERLSSSAMLECTPVTAHDLERDMRDLADRLAQLRRLDASGGAHRLAVLAVPSWDGEDGQAQADLGLALLRDQGASGFGIADLHRHSLTKALDSAPWVELAMELLHPVTNRALCRTIEAGFQTSTIQLLRSALARQFTVSHWRPLGAAQSLAAAHPDRYEFDPSPGDQSLRLLQI